jgi:hypothetical protein
MNVRNMADALARRDTGMQSSAAHAERVTPGWGEQAREIVKTIPRDCHFTMERAREWCYARGLPVPPEQRAWGAVTTKLLRDGDIEAHGWAPAASSHGSPKRTYRVTR